MLCRQLVGAVRGERRLLDGIHAYETETIDYGFTAVRNSLKTANMAVSSNRVGRIIGRTVFRTLNAIPRSGARSSPSSATPSERS